MGCFTKTVVRVGVIGALIAGAGVVLAHSARGRAIMHQAGHSINAKIDRGLAELDRGEGIAGDDLRNRLEADKAAWLADRSGS